MKLYLIIIVALSSLCFNAKGQDIGLTVGDKLPEFIIPQIFGDQKKVLTSNFKDQLLILDFWATNCSGCVAALPRINKLQEEFGSKIKILPITYEPLEQVSRFWKKNKYTQNLKLSTVVNDKIFSLYFKHRAVPHEVWIYKEKVIAITDADYIDAKNIRKILDGQTIDWPVKNDFYIFDGMKQSLFYSDTNQVHPSSVKKYVAISDYKEGVNSAGLSGGYGIVKDSNNNVRVFFLNTAIYTAYFHYWSKIISGLSLNRPKTGFLTPNQIVWEVSDKSRFIFDPKISYEQDWIRKFGICYESLIPDTGQSDSKVFRTVIEDLDRLLGLHVRWEKRKAKVWILSPTSDDNKTMKYTGRNLLIDNLIYKLNLQESNPYVFNETGYNNDRAIKIQLSSFTNLEMINKNLSPYNLVLKEQERIVDKFVFSQVNEGLIPDVDMIAKDSERRDGQKKMNFPMEEENKLYLDSNKTKPGVVSLRSGLQYKVIKMGTGGRPDINDKVKVSYTGTLVNGKIFDSSLQNGGSSVFLVKDVIKGWAEALKLMPIGSKWILYIPSELAYGSRTSNGVIPPNSTLIFELELINILD